MLGRRPLRRRDGVGLKCAPVEDDRCMVVVVVVVVAVLLVLGEGELGNHLEGHGCDV